MSNQEIERYYFERFRGAYALPEGEVKHGDKPDVIIEGQRKIGIEVTRFFLQDGAIADNEQKQDKIRQDVLQEAQRQFVDQGGKPIEISVGFNLEKPIGQTNKFVKKLVELAKRVEALDAGTVFRHVYKDLPELDYLYVNTKLYSDPKWRAYNVYTVPMMSIQRLSDIIRTKENKVKEYTNCDAYWLLIVVDFWDPAQDQEIRVEDFGLSSDVFGRIIIYKTAFDHIVEAKAK
ncbi:MAG: hypothetical protein ACREXW_00620 [Gammaproteobacteria bacterium]